MPQIFISYRRDDSSGYAHALADALSRRFGRENVYLDVTGVPAGSDFPSELRRQLTQTNILLALIGRRWLDARSEDGRRRIDDSDDFVRQEIEAALKGQALVIPVTLQGTNVPQAKALPKVLRPLAQRQAFALHDDRWEADVQLLTSRVERLLGSAAPAALEEPGFDGSAAATTCGITAAVALAGYVLTTTTDSLPYQVLTLPLLALVAFCGGAALGVSGRTSLWHDVLLGGLMALVVMLAIFGLNFDPGSVDYWPQTDRAWSISRQFTACLFGGFVLGSMGARLFRGRPRRR